MQSFGLQVSLFFTLKRGDDIEKQCNCFYMTSFRQKSQMRDDVSGQSMAFENVLKMGSLAKLISISLLQMLLYPKYSLYIVRKGKEVLLRIIKSGIAARSFSNILLSILWFTFTMRVESIFLENALTFSTRTIWLIHEQINKWEYEWLNATALSSHITWIDDSRLARFSSNKIENVFAVSSKVL